MEILKQMAATPEPKTLDHRARDVLRKRERRLAACAITIPEVRDWDRRRACLEDPFRFFKTYMGDRFTRPFSQLHVRIVESVLTCAKNGYDQAFAAPRGIGKTEIVKALLIYLILAQIVRFPIAIGATASLAYKIFDDVKYQFENNDLLLEDFPEICHPVRELEGAPQRAARQNVDGRLTRIVWKSSELLSFPYVLGSPYGGVKLAYVGLDGAVRGLNVRGDRPDLGLIDDPETRDSARNPEQCLIRENTIDRDIKGLAGHGRRFSRIILTTVQNSFCYSARVTDPKIKPAFDGRRFALVETWPTALEMWNEYVTRRQNAQAQGDKHAWDAVQFFVANYDAMIAGVKLNDDTFDACQVDGKPTVLHAIQECYNWIADNGMGAFLAEKQSEPEAENIIETEALSAALIRSRLAMQTQGMVPDGTERITAALDMGKRLSHWVVIAWRNPGIGTIIDYGVKTTYAENERDLETKVGLEFALKNAILDWAEDDLKKYKLDAAFIDSGTFTDAVYAAVRQLQRPFFATKGWDQKRFRMQKQRADVWPFDQCYAAWQDDQELFLYHVNTEYWKMWTHSRFAVLPYTDDGDRTPGSLAVYHPGQNIKQHSAFSHHIVAEELQRVPVQGGHVARMVEKSSNNHWLDATALAACGAGCFKIRVLTRPVTVSAQPQPQPQPRTASRFSGANVRPNFKAGNFLRR